MQRRALQTLLQSFSWRSGAESSRRAGLGGSNVIANVDEAIATGFFGQQQKRGVKIDGAEVRVGHVIERKGRPAQVLKIAHAQSGRGGATIQIEWRDIQSGVKSSERLRTTEAVDRIMLETKSFTYLYDEGDNAVLMDPENFEQMEVSKELFGSAAAYLLDGMTVTLSMHNGSPISGSIPISLTCKVVQAEPYIKGQTQQPQYKRVILENGKQIMAPQFIVSGDEIVVNTNDDSYITRAK